MGPVIEVCMYVCVHMHVICVNSFWFISLFVRNTIDMIKINVVCTGDANMGRNDKRSVTGRAASHSEVERWRACVIQ